MRGARMYGKTSETQLPRDPPARSSVGSKRDRESPPCGHGFRSAGG